MGFGGVPCLSELCADSNQISRISIGNAISILSLNSNTNLSFIDASAAQALLYLSANECSIAKVALPSPSRLEFIYLDNQSVGAIDWEINCCSNLRHLSASGMFHPTKERI